MSRPNFLKKQNVMSVYCEKLYNTIYGLNDASRSWYLSVKKELVGLDNCKPIGSFCFCVA